jgi:hypothetical protein
MMDGTFEDRVLERRAAVAVCHHSGKNGCFPPMGGSSYAYCDVSSEISRKFVEIVMFFWYHGSRIEQERLRKTAQTCRNAVCGVKWEI